MQTRNASSREAPNQLANRPSSMQPRRKPKITMRLDQIVIRSGISPRLLPSRRTGVMSWYAMHPKGCTVQRTTMKIATPSKIRPRTESPIPVRILARDSSADSGPALKPLLVRTAATANPNASAKSELINNPESLGSRISSRPRAVTRLTEIKKINCRRISPRLIKDHNPTNDLGSLISLPLGTSR